MFIVENAEAYIVNRIKGLTYPAGLKPKVVDKLGASDAVDIADFVKIAPSILVGITSDRVIQTLDAMGDTQMIEFTLTVLLVYPDKFDKATSTDHCHKAARIIREALRGHTWTAADGNEEHVSLFRYNGGRLLTQENGLIIMASEYVIKTMDT